MKSNSELYICTCIIKYVCILKLSGFRKKYENCLLISDSVKNQGCFYNAKIHYWNLYYNMIAEISFAWKWILQICQILSGKINEKTLLTTLTTDHYQITTRIQGYNLFDTLISDDIDIFWARTRKPFPLGWT